MFVEIKPHLLVYDKDTIYTVVYTEKETGVSYTTISNAFIQNKEYIYTKITSKDSLFLNKRKDKLTIQFAKKPKQKVNEMKFETQTLLVKGHGIIGNKLTDKEIISIESSKK